MAKKGSGQKFIARNRAPRVQIEYDVEIYGSEKKIQLPFVMGVLADLSGKPAEALPEIADRKFLEIDIDKFTRSASHLRRIFETLGVERRPRDVTPTLSTYLTHKDSP